MVVFLVRVPWVWESVHKLLDKYRGMVFTITDQDAEHEHRLTLFRRTCCLLWIWPFRCRFWPWGKRRFPWSGWLAPVERSGQTTQRTGTVFLVPDDADNVEGVAGQTWSRNKVVHVKNLPDLSTTPTPEQIAEYARNTWVSEDWVKQRLRSGKPFSRCLYGVPIEVDGERWGVIILDSRNPDSIKPNSPKFSANMKLLPMFLEELLKRA